MAFLFRENWRQTDGLGATQCGLLIQVRAARNKQIRYACVCLVLIRLCVAESSTNHVARQSINNSFIVTQSALHCTHCSSINDKVNLACNHPSIRFK